MTDWTKQMEEMTENMAKAWADVQKQMTDAQKQMWSSLAETADAWSDTQMESMWRQMVANWQEMVSRSLEVQSETMAVWIDNLKEAGAPEATIAWAQQMQETTKGWTGVQKEMWDNWFQMVSKYDPGVATANLGSGTQNLMKQWQEMAQNALQTQQEWLKSWSKLFTQGK